MNKWSKNNEIHERGKKASESDSHWPSSVQFRHKSKCGPYDDINSCIK